MEATYPVKNVARNTFNSRGVQHEGTWKTRVESFDEIIKEYRRAPAYAKFGPLAHRLQGPIVTISVGKELSKFRLPANWLVEKSQYFRAAFSSPFSEGQSKALTLAHEDPSTFRLFIHVLLTGRVGKTISLPGAPQWKAHRFVQLWVFADFLAACDVKSYAFKRIEEIVEPHKGTPFSLEPETIHLIYENTIPAFDHLELRWLVCSALKRRLTTWNGFAYTSSLNEKLWRKFRSCVEADNDLKVDLAFCECGIQSCIPWESRLALFERAKTADVEIKELMYLRFEEPCNTTVHCLFYWRPWLVGLISGAEHHWVENEGLVPSTGSDAPTVSPAESPERSLSTCGVYGDEEARGRSDLLRLLRG